MTLEEAIQHAQANRGCSECANENQQLAEWLIELKRLKDPIDEDKLNELAECFVDSFGCQTSKDGEECYKAGYRKAKEV